MMRKTKPFRVGESGSQTLGKRTGFKHSSAPTALHDADQFLLPTYKRSPILFTHGRGAFVFDSSGKKYLDFLGGIAVNALRSEERRVGKECRSRWSPYH